MKYVIEEDKEVNANLGRSFRCFKSLKGCVGKNLNRKEG